MKVDTDAVLVSRRIRDAKFCIQYLEDELTAIRLKLHAFQASGNPDDLYLSTLIHEKAAQITLAIGEIRGMATSREEVRGE